MFAFQLRTATKGNATMEIKTKITPQVIAAVTGLLQPYIPDLSPQGLVSALKEYSTNKPKPETDNRPLTRKEAADLLKCSKNTISRYLTIGKLRRIPLTERSCRIDPASVRALLSGTSNTEA